MAPCKPLAYSAGSNPVSKFEDAFVVTKHRPPPGRTFHFHVVLRPQHPRMRDLLRSGKKPPTHFHPRQWEFFRVVRGSLTVEIDGRPHAFTAEDGEYALRPGPHHCLYATEGQRSEVVEFWLSASPSGAAKELDQAFFENWYGYQEDMLLRGVAPDPIQVLSMFDAGDSYLSPPWWCPFRRAIGRALGVLLGRYLGGLLGYAPFHPEWTTDWEAACVRMEACWAQRRFAVRGLQAERRAAFLARGEGVGNGGLYAEGEGVVAVAVAEDGGRAERKKDA